MITAFFVGLKSRIAAFGVQRYVNRYQQEPLLAILPGVALQELWDLIGVAEKALLATRLGSFLAIGGLSAYEMILIGIDCLAGLLIGLIPIYQIYRYSLAEGPPTVMGKSGPGSPFGE